VRDQRRDWCNGQDGQDGSPPRQPITASWRMMHNEGGRGQGPCATPLVGSHTLVSTYTWFCGVLSQWGAAPYSTRLAVGAKGQGTACYHGSVGRTVCIEQRVHEAGALSRRCGRVRRAHGAQPPTCGVCHAGGKGGSTPYDESINEQFADDLEHYKPLAAHYPEVDLRDLKVADKWVQRHPHLIRLTGVHPFNVEPPLPELLDYGFYSPVNLHIVRNHGAGFRGQAASQTR